MKSLLEGSSKIRIGKIEREIIESSFDKLDKIWNIEKLSVCYCLADLYSSSQGVLNENLLSDTLLIAYNN